MSGELFIAIQCEELPDHHIAIAESGLKEGIVKLLRNLNHDGVTTWSTPRCIALSVKNLTETTPVEEELITGPPEKAAFRNGEPTKAALGFARSKGKTVEDLQIIDTKRGRVVALKSIKGGVSCTSLLKESLHDIVASIQFPKTMRWGKAIRKDLLEMGISLYEFRPDAKIRGQVHSSGDKKRQKTPHGVHAKSMIIDDDKTIVTTFNLDPRSANLNTENYVLLESQTMNSRLAAMFEKEMLPENSWKITVDWNPDAKGGCAKNFFTFISVLVPRSLL